MPDLFGSEGEEQDEDEDEVQLMEAPRREREARLRREREREEQEMARAIAASLAESGKAAEGAPPGEPIDLTEEDEELDDDEDDAGEAFDFQREARLYDDEDAQLQAAINASLQGQALPADWKPPAVEPVRRSAERAVEPQPQPQVEPVEETVEEEAEEEDEPVVEELSAEELRRKRLERFK